MGTEGTTGLSYADLEKFPEDNLRREIIEGELFVTAAPLIRHQGVVMTLGVRLYEWAERHGGLVFASPVDVYFSDRSVVEPDVLFVRAEHMDRVEERLIRGAPDIVVEVSSPSTRGIDLVRKRDLYERFGVPEYWFVDLDADRLEVYRLQGDRYPAPLTLTPHETLETEQAPGFSLRVAELLGIPRA